MTKSTKRCPTCKETKPLGGYYRHAQTPEGVQSVCKQCHNEYRAKHRVKFREKNRETARARQKTPLERERHRERQARYKKENPDRIRAGKKLCVAIKRGRIIRPTRCGQCSKTCTPQGHHHAGYERWDDVQWLCAVCHVAAHRNSA